MNIYEVKSGFIEVFGETENDILYDFFAKFVSVYSDWQRKS